MLEREGDVHVAAAPRFPPFPLPRLIPRRPRRHDSARSSPSAAPGAQASATSTRHQLALRRHILRGKPYGLARRARQRARGSPHSANAGTIRLPDAGEGEMAKTALRRQARAGAARDGTDPRQQLHGIPFRPVSAVEEDFRGAWWKTPVAPSSGTRTGGRSSTCTAPKGQHGSRGNCTSCSSH